MRVKRWINYHWHIQSILGIQSWVAEEEEDAGSWSKFNLKRLCRHCFNLYIIENREDSSDGEGEEENEPDLEMYSADIGRVVVIEGSDKKRIRDNWFPGLIVIPSAQPTVRINVKDEFLVRSFRDGRYYTVPKKEIMEFKRESKADMSCLKEAIEKALKYMDQDELPPYWERNSLFNSQSQLTDSDDNYSDVSTVHL